MECMHERVTLVDRCREDDGCGWVVRWCDDCGATILPKYENAPNFEMSSGFPKDAVAFRDLSI